MIAAPEIVIPYFQRDGMRVAIVEKGVPGTVRIPGEMAIPRLVIDVDVVSRYRTAHRNLFGLGVVENPGKLPAGDTTTSSISYARTKICGHDVPSFCWFYYTASTRKRMQSGVRSR